MIPLEQNRILNELEAKASEAHFVDELARSHLRYSMLASMSGVDIAHMKTLAEENKRPFEELLDSKIAEANQ